MVKNLIICFISLFILSLNVSAQWEKANGGKQLPDSTGITAVVAKGNTIITATSKGVFVSTNNGDNWSLKNTGLDVLSRITTLGIKDEYIIAGTDNSVFISSNNGDSWVSSAAGMSGETVNTFAVIGNNVFAGTSSGVYYSSNNCSSWAPKNTGIPDFEYVGINALSLQGSTIYAGTTTGVYVTTNNGDSWSKKNFSNEVSRLVVAKSAIFLSGEGSHSGLYVSTDNGSSWTEKDDSLDVGHDVHYSFITVGDSVFAGGTWSGVYLTINNADVWNHNNYGLSSYAQSNELTFALNDKYVFVGSGGETGFCTLWRLPRKATGVNDNSDFQQSAVKVFPVPANDRINLTIELTKDELVSISVYDELGNQLLSIPAEMKSVGTNNFSISTASLTEGMYFLKVKTTNSSIMKKIVVVR